MEQEQPSVPRYAAAHSRPFVDFVLFSFVLVVIIIVFTFLFAVSTRSSCFFILQGDAATAKTFWLEADQLFKQATTALPSDMLLNFAYADHLEVSKKRKKEEGRKERRRRKEGKKKEEQRSKKKEERKKEEQRALIH